MATESLSISEMLANEFEPKKSYQWVMQIDGIDSFTFESATRPNKTYEEIVLPYINTLRYISGRMVPQTMEIVLKDPIAPSAAQKVMNWLRLNYESETGRAGYSVMYKKDIYLKLLDGIGNVVEKWELKGTWVTVANFNELTYETGNAPVKINCTLRWDRAILSY